MSDNGATYDRNGVAIAVPDDDFGSVYAIGPDVIGQPTAQEGAVPPKRGGHVPDWDVWGSKLVDVKGVAKPP
eukprot:8427092-Heterocapsa_arctica.AAC.1